VVSFDFDFGDGQGRATSGIGAQFVADHDYAPGTYKACVTVRDDAGRSATSCQWMHPGVLVLHHGREKSAGVELPEWETCQDKQAGSPRSATFFVGCETAPLAGATVTVSTAQWQDAAVTDANGSVKFSIPENRFVPAPAGLHGSFAIGAVAVEASKPGYRSDTRSLWLMDCEGRAEIAGKVAEAKRKFAQWLERYQIIEFDISILKGKPTNPRASDELLDIGATLDTLDTLVRTVGRGATTLPIRQLLGIEGDVRAGLGIISRRFDTVLESIDEVLGQMSRELDGDIRGGGQVGDSEVRERRPPLGVDLPGTGEF